MLFKCGKTVVQQLCVVVPVVRVADRDRDQKSAAALRTADEDASRRACVAGLDAVRTRIAP